MTGLVCSSARSMFLSLSLLIVCTAGMAPRAHAEAGDYSAIQTIVNLVSPPPADRMQQPAQPEKEVQAAEFVPLMDKRDSGPNVDLDLFMDIPLSVTVELGRTEKSIQELLSISPGAVIELDKMAGEPVDILVNQKRIARGEVVVVDENFGVRVTEIYNEEVRLTKLR